jgi:mycothiol synthase
MSVPDKQQLQMLWPEHRVGSPPELIIPAEYKLRTFRSGDGAGYLEVMRAAGFDSFDSDAVGRWATGALPGGFFVIVHRATGQIVATAMANHNPSPMHPSGGELGWVAGSADHSGKRLGRGVCAAVTARFLAMGYRRVYLRTDDWRLPAIKTYLRLGYVPFLFAEDMQDRWRAICAALDWPFAPEAWPWYRAPVSDPPAEERLDADCLDRYPRRHKWLPNRPHRGYALAGDVDAFGDESLYHPSQLGTVRADPLRVTVGDIAHLCLTFCAGPAGLPEGARVTYVMRGQQPLGRPESDYALRGPAGCVLEPVDKGFGFILRQGRLQESDQVVLAVEPFRWTLLAGRREFKVVVQVDTDGPQRRLPEPVVLALLPKQPERLDAVLPCTHRPGESLALQVTMRDGYDNRVGDTALLEVRAAEQRVAVQMVSGAAECTLGPAGGSPIRAVVDLASPPLRCVSNPSVRAPDLQLYVGDLHCHDFLSEAEGYPDEVYRWAIQERRLDFCSVVPQTHGWLDNETWTISKYMNERYLDEGRFVTWLGFEWQHSGYGDKVVHYLGGDQPYLPVDDRRYSTPARLYEALRSSDALVIGHHPGYALGEWVPGTDYDQVGTDVERLVELWSMHGSSEGYDPADRPLVGVAGEKVMDALRSGVRLGFVAGSDTHSARPGGSAKEPRPYWGGLAAVWAEDLTRRSVFRALQARHTYALTRARIVMKMTVNGALMGSEIPAFDRVGLRIDAWTPGSIRHVQVLKNARLLHTFAPDGDECHIQLEDQTGGPAFYHCRVVQADGELAVCSPVWVG